ncbi:MAG: hypothetical protein JNM79_01690 [Burkholderiales bacterium]|nr:hypothetical protein [Burkholderiales bacterium]
MTDLADSDKATIDADIRRRHKVDQGPFMHMRHRMSIALKGDDRAAEFLRACHFHALNAGASGEVLTETEARERFQKIADASASLCISLRALSPDSMSALHVAWKVTDHRSRTSSAGARNLPLAVAILDELAEAAREAVARCTPQRGRKRAEGPARQFIFWAALTAQRIAGKMPPAGADGWFFNFVKEFAPAYGLTCGEDLVKEVVRGG